MELKFTKFKQMESELEKIPQVKPEAHFELNDISKKIFSNKELSEKDTNLLEIIYDSLQDLERKLVSDLDNYRSKEIIKKDEFLVVVDYFLISNQKGPESDCLLKVFLNKNLSKQDCEILIQSISIPKNTKIILLNVYSKLIGNN